MLKILNAPSPFHRLNNRRIAIILGIGAFVAFFLLVFQPFGTEQADFPNKKWFLAGYGVVISTLFLMTEWIFSQFFFKEQDAERWTIAKQIAWIVLLISISLAGCYFYKQWFFNLPTSLYDFWGFYKIAITIAIFPITIATLIEYIFHLKRHQTIATKVNDTIETTLQSDPSDDSTLEKLLLKAENGKDQFEVSIPHLYYIQSADNYVEIVYSDNGLKKEILRNSLAQIEQQIPMDYILRCHRSFVVNLQQVEKISGNAQGYKLHLKLNDTLIPVARSKSKTILDALKTINQE